MSNGKTSGIARPSSNAQAANIRHAYERACLGFQYTSYIECHGTGTLVGDPLEVAAIGSIFGSSHTAKDPVLLGSVSDLTGDVLLSNESKVKTNLGHSEPVSGLAGLMKVILSMENGEIPATIGITRLNPSRAFSSFYQGYFMS